jgi:tagatose 1,6-diphosphate aldolase GatY/KbaY
MPIVAPRENLMDAYSSGYAIGAFNATNLMEIGFIIEAAQSVASPVIIQTTEIVARFLGPGLIVAVFKEVANDASIPVCLHLDHCLDAAFAKRCADTGYNSIMIDASRLAFEENVSITKAVCDDCHARGDIPVEAELGAIGGREDGVYAVEGTGTLCDPRQATEFVARTGVDALAPAVGTAHGLYKQADPALDIDRLATINILLSDAGPPIPLVLHGGTGLPPNTVRQCIDNGIAKLNIGTDLKKALIDTTFDYISAHRYEYDPGKIDEQVKPAIQNRVLYWIKMLGSAARARSSPFVSSYRQG